MADFEIAYKKTLNFEGGYDNHPADSGGETIFGVSRNNFPLWGGWKIVEDYKTMASGKVLETLLRGNAEFVGLVKNWYKTEFWNEMSGANIDNQEIANNIFDFCVNAGVSQGAKVAQRIVSVSDDGIIGSKTLKAINEYQGDFVAKYKQARRDFYTNLVARKPSQSVFLKGWLNRVEAS